MPHFTYLARNPEGRIVRGTIDALSVQAARESLKEMHMQAEEIYEVTEEKQAQAPPVWQTTPASASPPPAEAPFGSERKEPSEPRTASAPPAWNVTDGRTAPLLSQSAPEEKREAKYFPLIDTLRLYAGWLLSWYFLIFAFGSYDYLREFPFEIPLVSGLFQSPVIIIFALGAFLFLMLSSLHRFFNRGMFRGIILGILWVVLIGTYRMNM
ncbi:MAG: hypothetical protein AAB489_03650 [Patescibacteria group bacterium]